MMMPEKDHLYFQLLQACQSADLELRLGALEGLDKHGYLHLVPVPFLLGRLDAAMDEREQAAILRLLLRREEPLPQETLEVLLDLLEALQPALLREVVSALSVAQAEEMLDLLQCSLEECREEPEMSEESTSWEEYIPAEVLFALLAHPDVCLGALDVLSLLPPQSIPIEAILPYCSHEHGIIREVALATLWVAEERVPLEPILEALRDSEPKVRAIASHACMFLVEWRGEQFPLEPLIQALNDDYPPVREDVLDALGKAPLRAPMEPVVAALSDSCVFVRCAAVETLGLMGKRVPTSISPLIQALAASDPDPRVRQRASQTLLRIA
jgi:HEAT repeat protein